MDPTDRAFRFVEAINEADIRTMGEMMSGDHVFVDSDGTELHGREVVLDAWRRYFSMMPEYTIEVEETFRREGTVVIVGRAAGTYAVEGPPRPEDRWSVPAAWRAVVAGDRIAVWQVFVNPEPILEIMRRQAGGR
jgi:ketosteroid isomerase-like protein